MSAASQKIVDACATASYQKRLNRAYIFDCIAAKLHGLPEPPRVELRIFDEEKPKEEIQQSYYDRWSSNQQLQSQQLQPQQLQPQQLQPQQLQPQQSQTSRPNTAIKAAAAAAAITAGAIGLGGYLWKSKPVDEKAVITAPANGSLLEALRKRGYHLPGTSAKEGGE